ncbi:MAG TPA: pantoate--beta-alanine ligase [Kiritimatiellia bacterium]|nr:pantoate--beta-alanine ligase [Kiritimatiellia bacterium]
MDVLTRPNDMQATSRNWRIQGHRIGVVPTMGYLHEGHLSLVRLARERTDRVIVTLFVNPTQFGPAEDFSSYPRNLDRDLDLCRAEGVDIVFAPEPSAMYQPDASVIVNEDRLSRGLCGASRPGHFQGVLTVVAKLFNLTLPDLAVFGEKDAQQLRLIRRMVRDLNFPVELLAGPILREPDGLAMSSRNVRLTPDQRAQATCLYRMLQHARLLVAQGEVTPRNLAHALKKLLAEAPLAELDYLEWVDNETLDPVERIDRPTLLALAVRFGEVRLIDNTVLVPQRVKQGDDRPLA